jgi:hypothetical protein
MQASSTNFARLPKVEDTTNGRRNRSTLRRTALTSSTLLHVPNCGVRHQHLLFNRLRPKHHLPQPSTVLAPSMTRLGSEEQQSARRLLLEEAMPCRQRRWSGLPQVTGGAYCVALVYYAPSTVGASAGSRGRLATPRTPWGTDVLPVTTGVTGPTLLACGGGRDAVLRLKTARGSAVQNGAWSVPALERVVEGRGPVLPRAGLLSCASDRPAVPINEFGHPRGGSADEHCWHVVRANEVVEMKVFRERGRTSRARASDKSRGGATLPQV